MPVQSEKQRRYLWANEPEIARDWTDTYGSGIAKALGGRIGFFKGAQADTASGKSMSPGTSAGHTPGAGHRDSGGWSPGVGGTPYVPSPKKAPQNKNGETHSTISSLRAQKCTAFPPRK